MERKNVERKSARSVWSVRQGQSGKRKGRRNEHPTSNLRHPSVDWGGESAVDVIRSAGPLHAPYAPTLPTLRDGLQQTGGSGVQV